MPMTADQVRTWVETNLDTKLTDDQARCLTVLAAIDQLYNLPLIGEGWKLVDPTEDYPDENCDWPFAAGLELHERFVLVRIRHRGLATYDGAELTRLVIAGHEHACRVSINAGITRAVDENSTITELQRDSDDGSYDWIDTGRHPTYEVPFLRIQVNARNRDGHLYERHPALADVLGGGTGA